MIDIKYWIKNPRVAPDRRPSAWEACIATGGVNNF